ncbi:MAG: DUF5723 family protein [Bacteroidota bacterium]
MNRNNQKIFFSFFVLFLLTNVSFSQESDSLHSKKAEQSIELFGEGFINSNAITNNFITALYNGNFIDDDLKNQVKLRRTNCLGGALNIGLLYSFHLLEKNKNTIWYFSFSDRSHLDMKFSDNFFDILFYGNKLFAGDTAHLGNFRFNMLRYQQFCFGMKKEGDYFHGNYGFAFSFLNGEQNIFIKSDKANLFTDANGLFIDFDVAMDIRQSNTLHQKFFAQNGMGLSTNFFYEMPYISLQKLGKIKFELNDFGFIRWNNKSLHYSIDSSYHYDAVEVNDIFNLSNNTFPKPNIDSIIDRNTKFRKEAYTSFLPSVLCVSTQTKYSRQFSFEKGVAWWFNASAKPYYYMKLHFCTKRKNIKFIYVIGYGGYGRLHSGLEAKFDFAKYYSLHISNNYLFSSMILSEAAGQGMYLKLTRKF